MPPLLMTTLLSLLLTLIAPQSSVTLPHLSKISNLAAVTVATTQR